MANFPQKGQLAQGESPSLYSCTPEDPKIAADTDGGYEFRRLKFTRTPRAKIETGFLKLSHDDYLTVLAFYTAHTTVVAFDWTDYLTGKTYQVRFDEPIAATYQGIGKTRLWDVKFKMSEI